MDLLEINFRNRWEVIRSYEVVERVGRNGFNVRFAKIRPGAIQPPPPLIRWNGQEAVSANWSFWAPEALGLVEVVFTV